jgi:hypothetical protein
MIKCLGLALLMLLHFYKSSSSVIGHQSLVIDDHLSNLVMLFFLQWGFKSHGSGAGAHAANRKKEKLTMMRRLTRSRFSASSTQQAPAPSPSASSSSSSSDEDSEILETSPWRPRQTEASCPVSHEYRKSTESPPDAASSYKISRTQVE